NFFWNMATVQFDHRMIAYTLAVGVPLLAWTLRGDDVPARARIGSRGFRSELLLEHGHRAVRSPDDRVHAGGRRAAAGVDAARRRRAGARADRQPRLQIGTSSGTWPPCSSITG